MPAVTTLSLIVLVACALVFASGGGPYTPSDNAAFYPINSLNNPGALFPLGGSIPSARVHHTVTANSDYLFVYGGYGMDGSFLGDINLFYIPSQQWTGPIVRKQCCNRRGEEIETIGADSSSMNYGENGGFPDVSIGFQGDAPLPRAEHGSCVIKENMIVFGGVTELYGYVNDMYEFDPIKVKWAVVDSPVDGNFPRRRAGHAMVCDSPHNMLYIFGGRTSAPSTTSSSSIGLNDMWRYNKIKNEWTLLSGSAGVNGFPGVRQFASMILLNGNLYIFGGVNPANGLTYNDVWVFRVAVQEWELLYSLRTRNTNTNPVQYPSGDVEYQFAPPPLYLAHIIPIPESLDPTTAINTTFYGSDADPSRTQNGGFLIYGGVGGGGNCATKTCGAMETTLGQIYRFSLLEGTWTSPHTITGNTGSATGEDQSVNTQYQELQYVQSSGWEYARISSSPSVTDVSDGSYVSTTTPQVSVGMDSWNDRGKWRKTFAYEKVVYHPHRNVMYEFGGLIARKYPDYNTSASATTTESVLVPQGQSTTLTDLDILSRDQNGALASHSTGATPIIMDASAGSLRRDLWDRHTGEALRDVVDVPVNAYWDYLDGIRAASVTESSFKPIEFLRVFRTYTVSPRAFVLIEEDKHPLL